MDINEFLLINEDKYGLGREYKFVKVLVLFVVIFFVILVLGMVSI